MCSCGHYTESKKTVNRQSKYAIEINDSLRYNDGMRPTCLRLFLLGTFLLLPQTFLSAETVETLQIENLTIPKTLGKIEDRFQGTGTRWIIQIQDVHAHVTAQENIAAIVDHLNAVYGLQVLGLEGGWSTTRFAESWGLPSSREKQMLARGLLEDAQITGPAYAALFSQSPLQLVGIEEETLYQKNRDQYLRHLASRGPALEKTETLEKHLLQEKASLYNAKLKKFDDALMKFQEGKKPEVFFPLLLSELSAADVATQDLPQMLLFKEAFDKEQALDKIKLEAESKRLMETFKRKRLSFEELLKSGFIPQDQLARYPAASAYLELLRLQDKIAFRVFFDELETAVSRLKEKLFSSDEERLLDGRWNRFIITKSLLSFEATPKTLAAFQAQESEIREELVSAGLSDDLSLALDFYNLVSERDAVFFEKLTRQQALSESDTIAVTGGFHTEGLSRHLRDAGISYLVITPELGGEAPDQKLYYKRLADNITGRQTLSETQNRFFTPAFDSAFVQGVLFLQKERNIPAAIDLVAESFAGSSSSSPAPASTEAVTWETFQTWERARQLEWVREILARARDNNIRLYLLASQSVLNDLIQEPSGQKIWETVREERNNTVVVVLENPGDISSDLLGGKFKVERFQSISLEEASSSPKFKSRFQPALTQNLFAVILPENTAAPDSRMMALKKHPVSLFYRLFLSNPDLRQLAGQDGFLDLLKDLLEEIGGLDLFQKSA